MRRLAAWCKTVEGSPLGRFWAALSLWHQGAALASGLVFLALTALLLLAWAGGLVDQNSASIWAAMVAAGTALTTFLLGRLAEDLLARDRREQARLDLALALHAEIRSNLIRQRKTFQRVIVARKIERQFGPAQAPAAPLADGAPAADKPASSFSLSDDSRPILDAAIAAYEKIPAEVIAAVVAYSNVDGMFNRAINALTTQALQKLDAQQQAETLKAYYELGNETDAAASMALAQLRLYILDHMTARDRGDVIRSRFEADQIPAPYIFRAADFQKLESLLPPAEEPAATGPLRPAEGSDLS